MSGHRPFSGGRRRGSMPTYAELEALNEAKCLYVTTFPASDVYYGAQEILEPDRLWISGWALIGQESWATSGADAPTATPSS